MHKHLLLDFDGCLANTFAAQITHLNKQFGTDYKEADFRVWDTRDVLSEEEDSYFWKELFLQATFQLEVAPVTNAIEVVQSLRSAFDRMFLVSDRPRVLFNVTKSWMKRHGLDDIPIVFTRNPHTKSDQDAQIETKSQFATRTGLTHAIEDSGANAMLLATTVPTMEHVWLLDRPNNRDIKHPKIARIQSWNDIYDYVTGEALCV